MTMQLKEVSPGTDVSVVVITVVVTSFREYGCVPNCIYTSSRQMKQKLFRRLVRYSTDKCGSLWNLAKCIVVLVVSRIHTSVEITVSK